MLQPATVFDHRRVNTLSSNMRLSCGARTLADVRTRGVQGAQSAAAGEHVGRPAGAPSGRGAGCRGVCGLAGAGGAAQPACQPCRAGALGSQTPAGMRGACACRLTGARLSAACAAVAGAGGSWEVLSALHQRVQGGLGSGVHAGLLAHRLMGQGSGLGFINNIEGLSRP